MTLTFCATFYDVKIIRKIFNNENFPDTKYYILYGFFSFLIMVVVYALLIILIRFNEYIYELVEIGKKYKKERYEKLANEGGKVNDSFDMKSEDSGIRKEKRFLLKQYKSLIELYKIKLTFFFIGEIIVCILCFLYLVSFCYVYPATRKFVFISYGISLVFMDGVKIVYGLILGICRYVSIKKKKEKLYNAVRFMENWIH